MSIPTQRPPAQIPAGADAAAERAHARRWLVLAVLGVAQLMVILDATVMNVALPSAQHDLGFSDGARQWVVTAYALSFGSLLLLGGRLSDLLGRRATFVVGLTGFGIASAIGGAAQNFEVLVGARALQGVFGALLAPAALSLLSTTFTDPKERGKAFGIFGALAGAGGAIGLLLGGALTTYASWRWAMYVNIAFAAVALVGAATLLPKHVRAGARQKLDVKGTLAVSAGLFGLVYGFSHAESAGWGDPVTLGFLAAGVALLVLFGVLQTRVANPLLPPRVLLDRDRAASFAAVFIVGSGMFAVFLFLTYYLQATLGYSAVKTGVAFLPMVFALVVAASLSTAVLLRKIGARTLVTTGMVVAALGMVAVRQARPDQQLHHAHPPRPDHLRPRSGPGDGADHADRDLRGRRGGRRRRLRDGQHDAAGRRFRRRRAPEHRGGQFRRLVPGRAGRPGRGADRPGDDALVHDRLLVGHRDLRGRRARRRRDAPPGRPRRRGRRCSGAAGVRALILEGRRPGSQYVAGPVLPFLRSSDGYSDSAHYRP